MFEQGQKPFAAGKLIIVDERQVVPIRVLDDFVTSQRDVLPRLHTIFDGQSQLRTSRIHYRSADLPWSLSAITTDQVNRPSVSWRLSSSRSFGAAPPLVRADADRNVSDQWLDRLTRLDHCCRSAVALIARNLARF